MQATIKKMFGEEGYNTASVILQNTEMVKDFTAAVTGTNVAYEQAAINSDTAQAKLEQARNKMKLAAIDLGRETESGSDGEYEYADQCAQVFAGID